MSRRLCRRSRPHILASVIAACVLSLPASMLAQDETQTGQLWLDFLGDWHLASKQLLELELEPKFLISDAEAWRELAFNATYAYHPNHRWDLVGRVYFSWVTQSATLSTFEIRPVAGFRLYLLSPVTHRTMLATYNRLEGRYVLYRESGDWDDTYRYRNRLECRVSLNNDRLSDDRTWYAIVDAEFFVNFGGATVERFNDDWRLRAGLGHHRTRRWNYELIYTLQLSRNTLEDDFDASNHILRIRIRRVFS